MYKATYINIEDRLLLLVHHINWSWDRFFILLFFILWFYIKWRHRGFQDYWLVSSNLSLFTFVISSWISFFLVTFQLLVKIIWLFIACVVKKAKRSHRKVFGLTVGLKFISRHLENSRYDLTRYCRCISRLQKVLSWDITATCCNY